MRHSNEYTRRGVQIPPLHLLIAPSSSNQKNPTFQHFQQSIFHPLLLNNTTNPNSSKWSTSPTSSSSAEPLLHTQQQPLSHWAMHQSWLVISRTSQTVLTVRPVRYSVPHHRNESANTFVTAESASGKFTTWIGQHVLPMAGMRAIKTNNVDRRSTFRWGLGQRCCEQVRYGVSHSVRSNGVCYSRILEYLKT